MSKYIDADRLMVVFENRCDEADNVEAWLAYEMACEDVRDMPAADVAEVKHGKWMQEEYIDGEWYHTCSSCGMSLKKDAFDNFCGNCGASMYEVCCCATSLNFGTARRTRLSRPLTTSGMGSPTKIAQTNFARAIYYL